MISVPLETCKPDTTNSHKVIRSMNKPAAIPDQKRVAKLYRRGVPEDILKASINVDYIRMLQREKGSAPS